MPEEVDLAPAGGGVHPRIGDEGAAAAIDEIGRLLEGWPAGRNKATSIRLDDGLKRAADIAVRHGLVPSLTALVEQGLVGQLAEVVRTAVEQAALDEHYLAHPQARPDLAEIALAAARLDSSPLADRPELIGLAVDALGEHAGVDDILIWASGALVATAAP